MLLPTVANILGGADSARVPPPEQHAGLQCLAAAAGRHKTWRSSSRYISTSYVERHNLSVRITVRRFTRLTNAFSKKIENHCVAVALAYFAYNFIKVNRTLRMAPAMAAGVTDRLWDALD